MSVEIIGMVTATPSAEVDQPLGEAVDAQFVRRFAQAHEASGFDRVLVGYFTNGAEGAVVASFIAAATEWVGILLAYRPGVIAPPLAARQLATLDQFSGGRLALNVISGGSDADQQRDGDWLDHDQRYARTDEYLDILKRIWTAEGPVDHEGRFYRFKGALPSVRTRQQPHIPIYFSGSSAAAIDVAARHADTYMLWGEPLADFAEHVQRVRTAAGALGRSPRISVSFRPIVADTEEAAWKRAGEILERVRENRVRLGLPLSDHVPANVGSQRLLAAARRGEVLDQRLWTGVARLTGAQWNSTALVGTPEQVAETLGQYYQRGASTFLIRGFDPLEDAQRYGQG
ncbi:putative flavin-dependent oxidoreductase [Pseudomonas sp. BAY1663]|nr:putative flavin-dependent oxidoreductase [Pseudomonas sp. BAY1663]